jgi:glucose-1-phosphate cytidylyltransferase
MKVVLFCGGLGMRLRDYSDQVPKPMVPIGHRPIVWHLMKFYAHYGHKDFILCLGHKSDVIKRYFLDYEEHLTNDFVLTDGGKSVELLGKDIDDWRITFVDTGMTTNIGGRLLAVRKHLEGEQTFLANYTDNLSNANLHEMQAAFERSQAVAGFLCVRPNFSFHMVTTDDQDMVDSIGSVRETRMWSNGGYFIFNQEIFDYMREGEELVEQPFQRLIRARRLYAHKFSGFWACMDTFKEKQMFDELYNTGRRPWEVWRGPRTVDDSDRVLASVSMAPDIEVQT